jgi:hypothetical protein
MTQDAIPYLALAPYAVVALGLVITLVLFFSVKLDLERRTKRERRRVDEMIERLQTASAMPPTPEPVFVPVSAPAGLNINRRTHALRLLKKGQDVAHISAALGVPRQEIELLVRVQDLIANTKAKATQATV